MKYMVVKYVKTSYFNLTYERACIVKENLSYEIAWAYARHKKHTTKYKDYEVEPQR